MRLSSILLFLCWMVEGWSFAIGNPGQPWLMMEGIFPVKTDYVSFRAAYLNDYVYSQQVQSQLDIEGIDKPPINKLFSETALLTINLIRKLDLYGIVGTAKLQMDQEVYANQNLAWGAGTKSSCIKAMAYRLDAISSIFKLNKGRPTWSHQASPLA
jgi:hypothetical protein